MTLFQEEYVDADNKYTFPELVVFRFIFKNTPARCSPVDMDELYATTKLVSATPERQGSGPLVACRTGVIFCVFLASEGKREVERVSHVVIVVELVAHERIRFDLTMNTARKQHVISSVWYISLSRDWLSRFGFSKTSTLPREL